VKQPIPRQEADIISFILFTLSSLIYWHRLCILPD
jgi:hypothetical protein